MPDNTVAEPVDEWYTYRYANTERHSHYRDGLTYHGLADTCPFCHPVTYTDAVTHADDDPTADTAY